MARQIVEVLKHTVFADRKYWRRQILPIVAFCNTQGNFCELHIWDSWTIHEKVKLAHMGKHTHTHTHRRLRGTMLVPSYLSSPLPGSHLVTDSSERPVYQGDVLATFTVRGAAVCVLCACVCVQAYAFVLQVLVPHSVANSSIYPAMAVQYGHGLFGDQVMDCQCTMPCTTTLTITWLSHGIWANHHVIIMWSSHCRWHHYITWLSHCIRLIITRSSHSTYSYTEWGRVKIPTGPSRQIWLRSFRL